MPECFPTEINQFGIHIHVKKLCFTEFTLAIPVSVYTLNEGDEESEEESEEEEEDEEEEEEEDEEEEEEEIIDDGDSENENHLNRPLDGKLRAKQEFKPKHQHKSNAPKDEADAAGTDVTAAVTGTYGTQGESEDEEWAFKDSEKVESGHAKSLKIG